MKATRVAALICVLSLVAPALGQWVARNERWHPRGPWNWAVSRELPQLYREFNGIDFGHAHLAQTLLKTQDQDKVEKARVEVLDFIFSEPSVPPDEDIVSPTFSRMVWEVRRTFNWTHSLHRALCDLFAADNVTDKEAAYRRILDEYLSKPEAITPRELDHHGKLWTFPESKSFRDKFRAFNTQIWAYHWLQAGAYDVQLMGNAERQRDLFVPIIAHYHGYLREPPLEWESMPMFHEVAPEFTKRFPEAAHILDNLHMLHDNVDDVLSRPDLFPTHAARRERILEILAIYLHRNQERDDRYAEYRMKPGMKMDGSEGGKMEHGKDGDMKMDKEKMEMDKGKMPDGMMMPAGPRPPSVGDVLAGRGEDKPAGEMKTPPGSGPTKPEAKPAPTPTPAPGGPHHQTGGR
jgi:hypothetical protein